MSGATIQVNLAEVAEAVARGLSKATLLGDRAYIRTSVLLPSGTTVVVAIEPEGSGRYRVSDLGQGQDEADVLDLPTTYRAQAKEMALIAGVPFDGHTFILSGLKQESLIGATMAVANAMSRALERAIQRADQRARTASADRLVSRLRRIFPNDQIKQEVDLKGASSHAWKVDAVVTGPRGSTVFDIVTPHQTSIAFATTKFHDLARLENAPMRIAVVHKKAAFGDMLKVINQAAKVIEDEAGDQTYMRAAMPRAA